MRVYDTSQASVMPLKLPTDGQPVRLYVCGVTPYDAAHAGHIFTFLTYDLLQRRLEDMGHEVRLVRNVTDVDEPIYKRAAETGEDYRDLAARETARLQAVLQQLNFRPAFAEPKASEYIDQMAVAVQRMLDDGSAYRLEDNIYFDVSTVDGFARSTHIPDRLLNAFMADRGGDPERPGKRQPLDFLLWRGIPDQNDPIAWDSPVGRGRPGWHIECSVMSDELLGTPFDIHGGGADLIFPHHASEQAQTRALYHSPQATHWIHVAPLLLYGEKMSKSLGNLVFAHELLATWSPAAIRLAMMRYHFQDGGEWHETLMPRIERLATAVMELKDRPALPDVGPYLQQIREAFDDNLDMRRVLRILSAMTGDRRCDSNDMTTKHADLMTIYQLLGL